jgi:hypothetical protein
MKKPVHKGKPAHGVQAGIVSSTQQAGAQMLKCPECGCAFSAHEPDADDAKGDAVPGSGLAAAKALAKKKIASYQQMNEGM